MNIKLIILFIYRAKHIPPNFTFFTFIDKIIKLSKKIFFIDHFWSINIKITDFLYNFLILIEFDAFSDLVSENIDSV